jgi:DNA-binding response OmpR family regulator
MTQKAHLLLVDDEPNILFTLTRTLNPLYTVTAVGSGEEALELVSKKSFDLVLLDIHLPGISGLEALEAIERQQPQTAIIMLTGFSTVDSAVQAMRKGAINYLQKPASKAQILESVKEGLAQAQRERQRDALLLKARQLLESSLQQLDEVVPPSSNPGQKTDTRPQVANPDRFLQKGPLVIDLYRRKATLNEALLDLTAGEYDLLLVLVQKAPQVLSPQALIQETRGYDCSLSEARELIRWQVYLLRQKVEIDPSAPQYILNVRGRGYMWAAA